LFEGLRKNVVAAEVENFGPEILVGVAGQDDKGRRIPKAVHELEEVLPRAVGEFALACDDGGSLSGIKEPERFPETAGCAHLPVVRFENAAERPMVFLVRADEEGNIFSDRHRCG